MKKEQLKKLVIERLTELRKERDKAWIIHFKKGDFAKHLRNLPDTPDNILVILKGHLLVEQEINRLLEAKLPNPDAINLRGEYGPRFIHKLSLLRALIPKPEHVPDIWDLIQKLNKLRNDFSHKLSCERVEPKIDKFVIHTIKAFCLERSDPLKKHLKKGQRERIQISLFFIIAYLAYLERSL